MHVPGRILEVHLTDGRHLHLPLRIGDETVFDILNDVYAFEGFLDLVQFDDERHGKTPPGSPVNWGLRTAQQASGMFPKNEQTK